MAGMGLSQPCCALPGLPTRAQDSAQQEAVPSLMGEAREQSDQTPPCTPSPFLLPTHRGALLRPHLIF